MKDENDIINRMERVINLVEKTNKVMKEVDFLWGNSKKSGAKLDDDILNDMIKKGK